MTRRTSIAVYREIEANGLLSRCRWQVYKTLFCHGPLSASEIAIRIPGNKSASVGYNIHARLCELREMLAVEEVGEKSCSNTRNKVILWDVTDRLPKQPPRKKAVEKIKISKEQYERAFREADRINWREFIQGQEGPMELLWRKMKEFSKD